jgi:DNA-binding Lrp family transcriptional regulator
MTDPDQVQVLLHRHALSRTDQAIVANLQEDGRRAYVNIARDIGVTEKTVRNRVKHLVDSKVIQIVALTSPAALGYRAGAMLGIVTDANTPASDIAAQIAQVPQVDYVVVTAGRFALLVELLARDMQTLRRIVETQLGKVAGVQSMEVFPYFRIDYQQARFLSFRGDGAKKTAVRAKEMDASGKRIAALLSVDGRLPVNEMAERLKISETQIRNRIKTLVTSEQMSVMAIINPLNLSFEAIAWVALKATAHYSLRALADDLNKIDNVSYVVICGGRFDIFAEIVGRNIPLLRPPLQTPDARPRVSSSGMHLDVRRNVRNDFFSNQLDRPHNILMWNTIDTQQHLVDALFFQLTTSLNQIIWCANHHRGRLSQQKIQAVPVLEQAGHLVIKVFV